MSQREYQVTGMTCGHCELSVREEVEQVAGVADIRVSATAGTLTISAPADLDDAGVLAAVEEAGYSAARV
ncbi:heavy-metal-associated domain-containing protein [Agromyces tropicus]|uniref:Heavy-metal-associated domain-containing protein n=1 Tax=Agromyces tropicus TaxID=555371 RepID=A0ABP5FUF5_9MICO